MLRTNSRIHHHLDNISESEKHSRCCDRVVVGFLTTYAISAYHHWCCEFESRSGRGLQHYVIKFVSATGRWFSPGPSVSSTNKNDRHDITEILLKVALNTIKQTNKQTNIKYKPILATLSCRSCNLTMSALILLSVDNGVTPHPFGYGGQRWQMDCSRIHRVLLSYCCEEVCFLFSGYNISHCLSLMTLDTRRRCNTALICACARWSLRFSGGWILSNVLRNAAVPASINNQTILAKFSLSLFAMFIFFAQFWSILALQEENININNEIVKYLFTKWFRLHKNLNRPIQTSTSVLVKWPEASNQPITNVTLYIYGPCCREIW